MIDSRTPAAESRIDQVVADWVWGWALSRGTPDPVTERDGYRIDVGLPGHRVRHVLPDPGSVGPRAAELTGPDAWLKVCGSPEQVRPGLGTGWTIGAVPAENAVRAGQSAWWYSLRMSPGRCRLRMSSRVTAA